MRRRITDCNGFSLIEVLMVISIMSVLFSVVLPAVNGARDKALVTKAIMELDGIRTAFDQLYSDAGYYPNGDTSYCRDVSAFPNNEVDLSQGSAGLTANGSSWTGWDGPYMAEATDSWGTPYYLDEDYQCMAATQGCQGLDDVGNDSSVIVSCGPNAVIENGSCAYDADNIVLRLCDAG